MSGEDVSDEMKKKPQYGIATFKSRFGGYVVEYPEINLYSTKHTYLTIKTYIEKVKYRAYLLRRKIKVFFK